MDLLVNAIGSGAVSGGIMILVFKFILSRWEKREAERDAVVRDLEKKVDDLKDKDIDLLKTRVDRHVEKDESQRIRHDQETFRQQLKDLTTAVSKHIEADNSQSVNERLTGIEKAVHTMMGDLKNITREMGKLSHVAAETSKQDAQLEMLSKDVAKYGSQLDSTRGFLEGLNRDYQIHKREDHR